MRKNYTGKFKAKVAVQMIREQDTVNVIKLRILIKNYVNTAYYAILYLNNNTKYFL